MGSVSVVFSHVRASPFLACLGREEGLTFDGRIVLIDKVALDELDGEAGLAHTTTANDYQLVFP